MRIDIDGPDVDVDDSQRYLYRGEPFTGELYECGPGGTVIALFEVLQGFRHGLHREWFPDGTPRFEMTVVGPAHRPSPGGSAPLDRQRAGPVSRARAAPAPRGSCP